MGNESDVDGECVSTCYLAGLPARSHSSSPGRRPDSKKGGFPLCANLLCTLSHVSSLEGEKERVRLNFGTKVLQVEDSQVDFSRAASPRPQELAHSSANCDRRNFSVSELASGSTDRWEDAQTRNKCRLKLTGPTQYTDLASEIEYPSCILGEKFAELISSCDEDMFNRIGLSTTTRFRYRPWVESLPLPRRNQVDDPYNLERWCNTLHKAWSSHFVAVHRSGNETEIRNGTDNLFELAFQQRSGWEQLYKADRDVFLPNAPFTATANIIVTMPLPSEWRMFLTALKNPYVFASELVHGEVVTFVSEAKCQETTAARRQLTFDLCSAQHQRRALGFDDGEVFGATIVGNNLTIFTSSWVDDEVSVYPLEPYFDLSVFPSFIASYVALCKLSDYVRSEVNNVFQEWGNEEGRMKYEERGRDTAAKKPWRPKDRPRSKSRGPSRLGGDGSSAQDAMEPVDMEDWGSTGDIETYSERQLVDGDNRLVRENLRLLDAQGMPTKDITRWTHTLAESYV